MTIDKELHKLLRRVEKPARYIGGEVNSVIKDPAAVSVRVGFAFPDTYEIGMSYLGMQILYNILNKNDDIYCERVFAPADDMEQLMRENGRELFTLETLTPIREMDIVGFTLQYELCYTNILNMLELGGIPVRSDQRGEGYPVIVAGGPCAYNPEPLADFIDLFMIGDGEELFEKVCIARRDSASKKEFLETVSQFDGVYIPGFYEPEYNEDGTIRNIRKLNDKAPDRVRRALISDLEKADFPDTKLVAFVCPDQAAHNKNCRNHLRRDGCNANACNAELEYNYRYKVENNVDRSGKQKIVKRSFRVADGTENGAAEIVNHDCRAAAEIYSHIKRGKIDNLIGRTHQLHKRICYAHPDNTKHDSARNTESHCRVNRF